MEQFNKSSIVVCSEFRVQRRETRRRMLCANDIIMKQCCDELVFETSKTDCQSGRFLAPNR